MQTPAGGPLSQKTDFGTAALAQPHGYPFIHFHSRIRSQAGIHGIVPQSFNAAGSDDWGIHPAAVTEEPMKS